MHRIYANLIQQDIRTLESVPEIWREKTRIELEERGWKPPTTEYQEG